MSNNIDTVNSGRHDWQLDTELSDIHGNDSILNSERIRPLTWKRLRRHNGR
jgi:hypothetical protein